jgi:hypothetical protein
VAHPRIATGNHFKSLLFDNQRERSICKPQPASALPMKEERIWNT